MPPKLPISMPSLDAILLAGQCQLDDGSIEPCVAVLARDWAKVVRELKKACIALGNSEQACQAEGID